MFAAGAGGNMNQLSRMRTFIPAQNSTGIQLSISKKQPSATEFDSKRKSTGGAPILGQTIRR